MSTDNDSDISSFAEREAQNPAQSFSEREQGLLDMKDPTRVWGDRDSRNDARSSDEESTSEDEELNGLKGGVALNGSSDGKKRLDIPSSKQDTESQLLGQHMENDALPSSQACPKKSDEDQDENSILSTLNQFPKTAHDFLQLKTSILNFAAEHPFWIKITPNEEESLEFERDVFKFAIAAGLRANTATVEVMRAMGAWKTSKGIPVAQGKNVEQFFEKVLETVEMVMDAIIGSGKKKRKREAKIEVVPGPRLIPVETVENSPKVEVKGPNARRQRRRENKSKAGEEPMSIANSMGAVEPTKDEQADIKSKEHQRTKKRKLDEEATSTAISIEPVHMTTNATPEAKQVERLADSKRRKEQMKSKPDNGAIPKSVLTAKPIVESKSAKRIKSEKMKAKKMRAKQRRLLTSSYSTGPEPSVSTNAKESTLLEEKVVCVTTQDQPQDIPMKDAFEEKQNYVADDRSAQNEETKLPNKAGNSEKKERKKKRKTKRLPEVKTMGPVKAVDEPASQTNEPSAKPKDGTVELTKSAAVNNNDPVNQSSKKKRVRSRIMNGGQDETKDVQEVTVVKAEMETPAWSKKNLKKTMDLIKAVNEPASPTKEPSDKPKDGTVELTKSAAVNNNDLVNQSSKKKRVRSRIMKGGQDKTKDIQEVNVVKAEIETPARAKKNLKKITASPKTNTDPSDGAEINALSTEKIHIGAIDSGTANVPQLAVESAAIEQAPTKDSRKRKKNSVAEAEVEAEPVTTEATSLEGTEPPKKKSRNRNLKIISKLIDAQTTGVAESAPESLVELPDIKSEKNKHKRERSRKLSSVGMKVDGQASKDSSNSRHS